MMPKAKRLAAAERCETSARPTAGRCKTKILSLGGCVTHDVCMKAACLEVEHVDHLWRRPTIALMSRSPRKLPFLDAEFPPELARYWQDDFRKSHREELCASPEDALVFDVTRDVLCSLYEVEDLCFVIDPMSVKGILWYGDGPGEEKIRATLKQPRRLISHTDPDYFEIWRSYFDDFAAIARKFDIVIMNKLYFTTTMASEQKLTYGDAAVADAANLFLEEAYDYISSTYDFIRVNAIPRKMLVTGSDVPWSGPNYTHIQNEATALFAENLRETLQGDFYSPGRILIGDAIARMNKHEDLIRAHRQCSAEREGLAAQLHALTGEHQAHLEGAERQRHDLVAERDALAGQMQALAGEHGALRIEIDHLRQELHASTTERDRLSDDMAARLDASAGERQALAEEAERQQHAFAAEREALAGQVQALAGEHGALRTEIDHLRQELHASTMERDRSRDGVGTPPDASAGERQAFAEEAERQRPDLATERDALAAHEPEDARQRADPWTHKHAAE